MLQCIVGFTCPKSGTDNPDPVLNLIWCFARTVNCFKYTCFMQDGPNDVCSAVTVLWGKGPYFNRLLVLNSFYFKQFLFWRVVIPQKVLAPKVVILKGCYCKIQNNHYLELKSSEQWPFEIKIFEKVTLQGKKKKTFQIKAIGINTFWNKTIWSFDLFKFWASCHCCYAPVLRWFCVVICLIMVQVRPQSMNW